MSEERIGKNEKVMNVEVAEESSMYIDSLRRKKEEADL